MNPPEERAPLSAEEERPRQTQTAGKQPVTLKKRKRFPWLLLLVFLASVYYFWVWPYQRGDQPVQVEVTNNR